MSAKADVFEIAGHAVGPDQRRDVGIPVSENSLGAPISIPVSVWRGAEPGPAVFVTGAIHGDELNGAGVVREILMAEPFSLRAGTVVLAPVVNVLGFDQNSRYMPDRRDLNRSFPGSASGSMASRFAHRVFNEIVLRCDFGVDLHTAAIRRTNFPNVRADLRNPGARRLAMAFGCELAVHGKGPEGSLRRAACDAGVPTIILEGGEVWKIESAVVEAGVRGVRNVLIDLGMVDGQARKPVYQTQVYSTEWVRAQHGGFLTFHVAPGDVVEKGQAMATNTTLLGAEPHVVESPADGVILGMTTLPAVKPGEPIVHIALPRRSIARIRRSVEGASSRSLHERLRDDLATNVSVSEHEPLEPAPDDEDAAI